MKKNILLSLVLLISFCKSHCMHQMGVIEEINTKLLTSAKKGDIKKVVYCLDLGADVNTGDKYGFRPLHLAILYKCSDIVKLLLQRENIDINITNVGGYTPLHFAAVYGSIDFIEVLLKSGANVHLKDKWGKTPLNLAQLHQKPKHVVSIEKYIEEHEESPE